MTTDDAMADSTSIAETVLDHDLSNALRQSTTDRALLVARAQSLRPILADNARQGANDRRAAGQVVEAINILLSLHGSSGLVDASPLQQIWQDANVAARHVSLLPAASNEVYGKALLGLSNDVLLSL